MSVCSTSESRTSSGAEKCLLELSVAMVGIGAAMAESADGDGAVVTRVLVSFVGVERTGARLFLFFNLEQKAFR
ncbi:Hypothetical predicted protein [Octopus vulgaris]|uniref:Uncharacterized protein n=1 Tax=Octopus vulgaris TaxID=6645 RepID=A0AA36B6W1_OCTVU|nr:Hypothetical predicted protein [Octopus vulgaris]